MKISIKTLAIAFAFFMYCAGAMADDSTVQVIKRQAPQGITNTFYACIEKSDSDNIALAACQSAEKKRQDARLNAAYKLLLGKLRGTVKANLVRAERSWLSFHGTTEAFESSLYGNESVSNFQTMQNGIFRLCERANTLEKYLAIANDQ